MMGTRERMFVPLCNLALEALVRADHFYGQPDAANPAKTWLHIRAASPA
jgi:hypothetical protein